MRFVKFWLFCVLLLALSSGLVLALPCSAADPVTIPAQTVTIYAYAYLYDKDDYKIIDTPVPPPVQINIELPDISGNIGQETAPFDYSVDFIFPPAWLVGGQYWTITQDEAVIAADTFYVWDGDTLLYYGQLNDVFYAPAWGSIRMYNNNLILSVGDYCPGWSSTGPDNDDCILAHIAIQIASSGDLGHEYQLHMTTHIVESSDQQIWMYIQGNHNSPEISKGNEAVAGAVSAANGVAGDLAAGANQMRGATAAAKPYIDSAMQLIRNVAANFTGTFGGDWINTLLSPIGGILILVFGIVIFTKIFRKAGD